MGMRSKMARSQAAVHTIVASLWRTADAPANASNRVKADPNALNLGSGYRGISIAPQVNLERGKNTPGEMTTHDGFGSAQGRHELRSALHRSSGTTRNWAAIEPPVAKPGAAPARDEARMQSEHLSAPAAASTNELQEDAARAHANADDANLGRGWRAVVSLKGHCDTRHVGRQSRDLCMSVMRTEGSPSR